MGSLFSSCWNGRTEREDEDLEKGSTVKSATKNGLRQTDSGQAETKRGSAESAENKSSGAVEESVYLQAEKNVDPSSLNDSSMSFDSSTTTQPLLNGSSVFSKQLPEIQNAGKELGESSNPDTSSQGKDPSGASFSPEKSAVISYPFNNQFLFSVNTPFFDDDRCFVLVFGENENKEIVNYTFPIYSTYPRSEDLYTLTNVQMENIVNDIVNSFPEIIDSGSVGHVQLYYHASRLSGDVLFRNTAIPATSVIKVIVTWTSFVFSKQSHKSTMLPTRTRRLIPFPPQSFLLQIILAVLLAHLLDLVLLLLLQILHDLLA